jgi:hypothetical protein
VKGREEDLLTHDDSYIHTYSYVNNVQIQIERRKRSKKPEWGISVVERFVLVFVFVFECSCPKADV